MSALALLLTLLGVDVPGCEATFTRGLSAVERAAPPARTRPALEAMSACPALGALAEAARTAAGQPRAARAQVLVAASGIDRACARARCKAMPEALAMSPRALADLDDGSYAFSIAASAALAKAGLATSTSERILMNLLLGSALEGEAQRKSGK